MSLHVSLFGEFALVNNDGAPNPGALSRPRVQELMAWLLLHADGGGSRGACAAALWPTSSEAQARTNLRREWHALVGAIGPLAAMLRADRQRLWCNVPEGGVIDVRLFDDAVRALSTSTDEGEKRDLARRVRHCHGAPLLVGSNAEWLGTERSVRLASYRAALLFLAESAPPDDVLDAETCARDLLGLDPCDDGARLALMTLQARTGKRAAAAAGYRRHAERVRAQLGIEPSEPLRRFMDELTAMPAPAAATVPLAIRARPGEPAWVGRNSERVALGERLSPIVGAPARIDVVIVEGEAGMGKTRLVRQTLIERCRDAIEVRCHAAEGELAYRVPAGWLAAPALAKGLDRLPGYRRTALARAFPDIVDAPGTIGESGEPGPRSRALLFDALVEAVVPRNGFRVLVVDDLQWCDRDSLEWLAYLAHQPVSAPLVIVATLRSECGTGNVALDDCLDAIDRHGALHRLPLDPLASDDARRLVERNASSITADAGKMVQRAGGNPLYLLEMLAAAERGEDADRLPRRVHALIAQRFATLDGASTSVLSLAAVHERPFDVALIARLSGIPCAAVADTVDTLIERGLLRHAAEGRFEFVHDCFRETMLASIGPARRRFLHCRTAIALQQRHASEPDAVAGLVAVHHERGGETERALESYLRASRVAADAFAYLESAGLCSRALALLPIGATARRVELLDRQAQAVMLQFGFASPAVGEICEEIERLLSRLGDVPEALVGYERLRRHESFAGRPRRARELARRQLAIARRAGTPSERLRAARSLAFTQYQLGHYAIAHRTLSSASADAASLERSDRSDERWGVLMHRAAAAHYLAVRGRARSARTTLDACDRAAFEPLEPASRLYPMIGLGFACMALDDDDRLARVSAACGELALACPVVRVEVVADMLEGHRLARTGEVTKGIERMRRAMVRYEAIEDRHFAPMWNLMLGLAHLRERDHAAAERAARRGLESARADGEAYCNAELRRVLALALARRGAKAGTVDVAFDGSIDTARRQGARAFLLRSLGQAITETARRPAGRERHARLVALDDALARELTALESFGPSRDLDRARRVHDALPSRAG